MSYSFSTRKGTAASASIPTNVNLAGYTLTVEFSTKSNFSNVRFSKGATGTGQVASLSLSVAEVDTVGDAYYRLRGAKAGKTETLQTGTVDYSAAPLRQEGAAPTVTLSGPIDTNPHAGGDLIKTVQNKIRHDFVGTGIDASFWDVTTGPGMTVGVAGSNLTIASGTTANSTTILRSKSIWSGAYRVMFMSGNSLLSQRIANTEIELRVTNAARTSYASWLLNGTVATTGIARAYNNGTTAPDQSQAALPTTASPVVLELENFIDEVYFHSRAPESVNGRVTSNVKNRQTPDPNEDMYIEIVVRNLGTAPASSTTLTLDAVLVQDISELTTEITAGRGGGAASQAIPVSGTINISSPGLGATGLAKTEDSVHASGDVGVAVWGVRAPATPIAFTSAAGDYSPVMTDAEGKIVVAPSSADPANTVQAVTDLTLTTNVAILAAGAATIRNYVTDLTFDNTGAAAARVIVDDGTTRIFTATIPAGSTFTKVFETPLRGTAATAVNARLAATGTVTVSAQGFKGI